MGQRNGNLTPIVFMEQNPRDAIDPNQSYFMMNGRLGSLHYIKDAGLRRNEDLANVQVQNPYNSTQPIQ